MCIIYLNLASAIQKNTEMIDYFIVQKLERMLWIIFLLQICVQYVNYGKMNVLYSKYLQFYSSTLTFIYNWDAFWYWSLCLTCGSKLRLLVGYRHIHAIDQLFAGVYLIYIVIHRWMIICCFISKTFFHPVSKYLLICTAYYNEIIITMRL